MNAPKTAIDLFPFAPSHIGTHFGMPTKPSIILIRWPVVIICSYLLLYSEAELVPPFFLSIFILFYIASNVALYFVSEDRFAAFSFYAPLVIADTIVLTLSLVVNGHVETDFFLTFFFSLSSVAF